MLTPQELLELTTSPDTDKFEVYTRLREITSTIGNDAEALRLYIDSVKSRGKKWIQDKQWEEYLEIERDYNSKADTLNYLFVECGMPQDVYDEKCKELGNYPIPFNIIVEFPDNYNWALSILQDHLQATTTPTDASPQDTDRPTVNLNPLPTDTTTPTPQGDGKVTDSVTTTDTPTGASPEGWRLPIELSTPEAQGYFAKAFELGLMEIKPTGYKWLKGLQLLSCFAREMSLKLKLGKGMYGNKPRIGWKGFERAFNIPKGKLRSNWNDIVKTNIQPIGIEFIDQIFG